MSKSKFKFPALIPTPTVDTFGLPAVFVAALLAGTPLPARAATYTWTPSTSTWDVTSTNWAPSATNPWNDTNGPSNAASFIATVAGCGVAIVTLLIKCYVWRHRHDPTPPPELRDDDIP